jgi:signal transduction histidine kinase
MGALLTPSTAVLLRLGSMALEDWDTVLQEILRADSGVMGVERVNYWRLRADPPSLVCELGYHAGRNEFERGLTIRRTEAPRYFEETQRVQVLAIDDARADERSRELTDYLGAHGIGALLDVGVRVNGSLVGMLCHENLGGTRSWAPQEQDFALAVAQVLAARLEARARSRAEESERRTALLADVMARLGDVFDPGPAAEVAVRSALPMLGDVAALFSFDGLEVRWVAGAHVQDAKQPLLEELASCFPTGLNGPGIAAHALRERQSILVPSASPTTGRAYGMDDDRAEVVGRLQLTSAMAVPFSVRQQLKGAMIFGSGSRTYAQDDLRFAETYAHRIGAAIENAFLYQQAQDAIRARDQFLSLAAHELRTPLTTLGLLAETLATESRSISPRLIAQMSQRLARQARRLDRFADRLLDAHRVACRRPVIDRQQGNLVEIVRDVAHAFEGTIEASGSSLVLSGDSQVPGWFDATRVQQVIGNLIENAVKFGNGKPIEIDVRTAGERALITVRDHGVGIASDEQPGIFDRYERGREAQGTGGLGLGLHVVREIVEAHGGRIRVDSRPGAGSTFTVELPRSAPEATVSTEPLGATH